MIVDEIKRLLGKLRPYINGGLVTPVTVKYFDELEKLILGKFDDE